MFLPIFIFFPAWLVLGQTEVSRRKCNIDYEFPCENGECIGRQQWCDGRYDCKDRTDEYYCDGNPCQDYHFRCSSGRCIPKAAACDNFKDCPDGSDEVCGDKSEYHPLETDTSYFKIEQFDLPSIPELVVGNAVAKAASYLLNEMRAGNIKGVSIFRAIVALAFAERIHPLSTSEKELMKKQLNIELTLDLMHVKKRTLSELALWINALYAVCENPRRFHDKDLVNVLRTRTDVALKSTFNVPFVLLTLCVAEQNSHIELQKMDEIYKNAGKDRIGAKALALMAMICSDRRIQRTDSSTRVSNFFTIFKDLEYSNIDVYTKALFLQASHAAGVKTDIAELLKHQLPDGSFGDVLATYHAIPALLSTSILELKCEDQSLQMDMLMDAPIQTAESVLRNITYSIWITAGTELNSHSMVIEVDGNRTFYDVMKVAARRDPTYRFMCDDTVTGKNLYSIASIPNDPESGLFWTLYRSDSRTVDVNSANLREENKGLHEIVPKGNEHFIFRMRQERFSYV